MRRMVWFSVALTGGAILWFTGVAIAQPTGQGAGEFSAWEWFVEKGGPIGWLLILIDVVSWAIIIEHFISIRRVNILPEPVRQQVSDMVEAKQYREVIEYTMGEPSMLSHVLHRSLGEASHGYPAMERALEEACDERTTKLLRKIELLNVIGNVCPMLGLLGTVFGMILAFSDIVAAGEMPRPDMLAGSIGIALVTTFWGLVVAIPALAVYAIMRNRVDSLSSEVMVVSQEIISMFRPGAKKAANGG